MNGEADCRQRLHAAAQGNDLILIEGVMGLFDGTPSAADLAQHFRRAGAGGGRCIGHGGHFWRAGLWPAALPRPDMPWAGVLANRVGSERHAQMLRDGLRDSADWMGALMRVSHGDAPAASKQGAALLPERHLGLVAGARAGRQRPAPGRCRRRTGRHPLGQMTAQDLQRWAVDFPAPDDTSPVPALLAGRTVAVGRDAAFCFTYAANLQTLEQLGARVVFFSPLDDAALPECDAVWLPRWLPRAAHRTHRRQHRHEGQPDGPCAAAQASVGRVRRHDGAVRIHHA